VRRQSNKDRHCNLAVVSTGNACPFASFSDVVTGAEARDPNSMAR
jgi:hypothetical protein